MAEGLPSASAELVSTAAAAETLALCAVDCWCHAAATPFILCISAVSAFNARSLLAIDSAWRSAMVDASSSSEAFLRLADVELIFLTF